MVKTFRGPRCQIQDLGRTDMSEEDLEDARPRRTDIGSEEDELLEDTRPRRTDITEEDLEREEPLHQNMTRDLSRTHMSDEALEDMSAAMSSAMSAMPAQVLERLLPNQEHAPEPETEPGDLMAVADADALERRVSNWPAIMDAMLWEVQTLDARLYGLPMSPPPKALCSAPPDITPIPPPLIMDPRLHPPTGTQAHEDADASVAGDRRFRRILRPGRRPLGGYSQVVAGSSGSEPARGGSSRAFSGR